MAEFRLIVQNYLERRWSPAELSGGRFCEIVYTILDGYARSTYPAMPAKPPNFVAACRALEAHTHVPRSFQILIPRFLPALYEIRNNRGVGHVGGDVDPNHMDSNAVIGVAAWVLAELIRVFHGLTVEKAQQAVDAIVERRVPLVWTGSEAKRVLDPKLSIRDQVLLLLGTTAGEVAMADLQRWCGYKDKGYFKKLARQMHADRPIELSADETRTQMLPPGVAMFELLVAKRRTV